MNRFLFLLIICFSISCTAQSTKYGAAVQHINTPPNYTPTGANSSLLAFDSTEQSLFVHNKKFGWWKLFSPNERYVRIFIRYPYSKNQNINWALVEGQINVYAPSPASVKNGYYVVRFETIGGALDSASVNMPAAPFWTGAPVLNVTQNDIFVVRYLRGNPISINFINDKITEQINVLNDSLARHRFEIDSLKNLTPSVQSSSDTNFWRLKGNNVTDTDYFGSNNNKDVVLKTNGIQRAVFQKDGKNGFGVSGATQEVDSRNVRNRGGYYDYFNLPGEMGKQLKSFGANGTIWAFDFKMLRLTHSDAETTVQVGKSKDFLTFSFLEELHSINVYSIDVSNTNTVCRFFYYNASGQEVTITNVTITAGNNSSSAVVNIPVNFNNVRMEVTSTGGTIRGLTATLNFLDLR